MGSDQGESCPSAGPKSGLILRFLPHHSLRAVMPLLLQASKGLVPRAGPELGPCSFGNR